MKTTVAFLIQPHSSPPHRPQGSMPHGVARHTRQVALSGSVATILTCLVAVMLLAAPAIAQQITGTPGSPSATTTIDGKYLPPPPAPFGGVINLDAEEFQAVLAAHGRAAQGRAQRAADHDRRRRATASRAPSAASSRRRAGPHREDGAALHAVPLHRALLAHAGGADHRPQPSLRRLRRDRRAVHRLSRATTPSSASDNATIGEILKQNGYATSWFGKNHNTPELPVQRWPGPFDQWPRRHGLRVLLRLHGRRDRPVDAVPLPRTPPRSSRGSASPATTSSPTWRTRPSSYMKRAERGRARQAVLRLLRARRHPRAAPPDAGMDREVQGQVRHGLERAARADLRQPEAARRDPGEHRSSRPGRTTCRSGTRSTPTRRSCSRARRRSSPPTWPTPTMRSAA